MQRLPIFVKKKKKEKEKKTIARKKSTKFDLDEHAFVQRSDLLDVYKGKKENYKIF